MGEIEGCKCRVSMTSLSESSLINYTLCAVNTLFFDWVVGKNLPF